MSYRRNLGLLWIGQFISNLGDQVFMVLVTFLILTLEEDRDPARKAAVVQFLNYLPHLLFGLLAGTLVDRFDRRRAMILSDLARALIVLGIPVALLAGELNWRVVAMVAFGLTTFATVFNPARDAYIPTLAKGSLVRVNAVFQTSVQLAMIAGALLAGALVTTDLGGPVKGGAPPEAVRIVSVVSLQAFTFLVSAVTIYFIRVPKQEVPPVDPGRPSAFADFKEGLRLILGDPIVGPLLFVTAIDNLFLMGPAILGANLLVKEVFGMGPEGYAFLETALAAGWLVGSLSIARWGKGVPKGRLILAGMIMDGLTYIPVYFIRDFTWLLAAMAFHGFFIPWIVVGRTSLAQQEVPAKRLGRVFALINLTFIGFTGLSMILTGEASQAGLTPPQIFAAGGGLAAFCGVIGFFFRSLRAAR